MVRTLRRITVIALVVAFAAGLVFSCASMKGRSGTISDSKGGASRINGLYDTKRKDSPRKADKKLYKEKPKSEKWKSEGYAGDLDARDETSAGERDAEKQPEAERMVIYSADYRIAVDNVSSSVDRLTRVAADYKGFIESAVTSDSYRSARVVVRVPVASFEAALARLSELGEIQSRQVNASDVTAEFRDMSLRVKTAEKVRERLKELLKRTVDVKERIQILQEISRLTGIIDSHNARLRAMKDSADMSTIVVNLAARVREVTSVYIPSPFQWLAGVTPERRSMFKGLRAFEYGTPSGLFLHKKEFAAKKHPWLLDSPDGAMGIRLGVVKNYPPGDLKFWDQALRAEAEARRYREASRTEVTGRSGMRFVLYVYEYAADSRYAVAVGVHGKRVAVIEAMYRSDERKESREKTLVEFIKTVGPR